MIKSIFLQNIPCIISLVPTVGFNVEKFKSKLIGTAWLTGTAAWLICTSVWLTGTSPSPVTVSAHQHIKSDRSKFSSEKNVLFFGKQTIFSDNFLRSLFYFPLYFKNTPFGQIFTTVILCSSHFQILSH